ncbi:MAG: PorV/PorQ family protein [Ignavibacteriaceae bacterium]|nr:PorV/PorQ family protein [Ignavibacteriaceae bacterium]
MKQKILLFTLLSLTTIFAQSAGNSGLSFLKLGFGARNIALGDAGTALSSDVTSLFYNPAALALNPASEVMLMHNEWIQDVRSEILGARTIIFGLPVALGFNVTSIDNIEVRNNPGDPITKFSANYFFGSFSTGHMIVDNVYFGASIKYLYEGIYVDEATGWGFDFGATYLTSIKGLNISAALRNVGSMKELRSESTKLPTEVRIGPSYSFTFQDKFQATGAVEFLKYTPTKDTHFNMGAEILYDKLVALRVGYQTGYISKNITAGFGLMWGNLSFDYALAPFQLGLGNGNILSLQFKF